MLLLFLWAALASAQEPVTNLQLLSTTLQKLFEETEPYLAIKDSSRIQYASSGEMAAWDWMFEKILYEQLGARHAIQLRRVDPSALQMPLLFYAPIELKIYYETRTGLVRKTIRRAASRLYIKYQDAEGNVVFAREQQHCITDTVATSAISGLENQNYAFTLGERSRPSWLKRLAEPLMITVITGGIIYLFYSFRSN